MYILIESPLSESVIKNKGSKSPPELDEFFNLRVYDKDNGTSGVSELADLSAFLIKGLFPTFEWSVAVFKCKTLFDESERVFIPFWVGVDW